MVLKSAFKLIWKKLSLFQKHPTCHILLDHTMYFHLAFRKQLRKIVNFAHFFVSIDKCNITEH